MHHAPFCASAVFSMQMTAAKTTRMISESLMAIPHSPSAENASAHVFFEPTRDEARRIANIAKLANCGHLFLDLNN
jgi:hypothetical protein